MYRRIATLESETKDILGNIRKSKPLLQDFCLLGIGQGAPVEFVEKCSALETHYSTQILQRARPVSPSSLEGGGGRSLVLWAQQMCDLWRQQTGLIRQVIDKAEKKGGIDDSSIRQVSLQSNVVWCGAVWYIYISTLSVRVSSYMCVSLPLSLSLFLCHLFVC